MLPTVIPLIIVARPLGEGDFINEALVATIINNNFTFTIYRVYRAQYGILY